MIHPTTHKPKRKPSEQSKSERRNEATKRYSLPRPLNPKPKTQFLLPSCVRRWVMKNKPKTPNPKPSLRSRKFLEMARQ